MVDPTYMLFSGHELLQQWLLEFVFQDLHFMLVVENDDHYQLKPCEYSCRYLADEFHLLRTED